MPEKAATVFEVFGMHRVGGDAKSRAATVSHKIAHTFGLFGFIAGIVIGALAALAVGALIVATAGAGAVAFVGAAAAGGLVGGFIGTSVSGGLAKMGSLVGAIATGSPNTFIGSMPVARMTDTANCLKEPMPSPIVEGSKTIYVNGLNMVRVGHKLACGATVDEGFPSVFLDQTTEACAAAAPDVPLWARIAADWGLAVLGGLGARKGGLVAAERSLAALIDRVGPPRGRRACIRKNGVYLRTVQLEKVLLYAIQNCRKVAPASR